MLKICPTPVASASKPRKRSRRKAVPDAKSYFEAYPHLIEQFKAMTVGGVPLFLEDGRLSPDLYIGGKEYDGDKPSGRRRPPRSVRRVA